LPRRWERTARPARVRMRSRKPWVFARLRLFGWYVRLLTSGSPSSSAVVCSRGDPRRARSRHTSRVTGERGHASRQLYQEPLSSHRCGPRLRQPGTHRRAAPDHRPPDRPAGTHPGRVPVVTRPKRRVSDGRPAANLALPHRAQVWTTVTQACGQRLSGCGQRCYRARLPVMPVGR
jgi:hypothetical protein